MNDPVQLLLSRLDSPRPNGRDRWRAACPVCGGKNRSTLSVGIGDSGVVLVKCFKTGCGPDAIAQALGLALEDLFPAQGSSGPPLKRRRMVSANQGLEIVAFECLLVWTAAFNLANGHALTTDDLQRLSVAGSRIQAIVEEALS
jgi:hypothetical protein